MERVSSMIKPLFDKLESDMIACLAFFERGVVMYYILHALYVPGSCLLLTCLLLPLW